MSFRITCRDPALEVLVLEPSCVTILRPPTLPFSRTPDRLVRPMSTRDVVLTPLGSSVEWEA